MTTKLLLAEDSLTIQKVFELTLKQSGISLTVVDNGVDAIRLAKEISPDLVVADVSLPGKDGFEVADELRSPETGGSFPVLILAGSLAPFDEERFKSCGASGVLFKPFESQDLIHKVEALLRNREEYAPAPEDEEQAPTPPEEPWDFSDVVSEMEKEETDAVSRAASVDDLAGEAAAPAGDAESTLSLRDFDVSLEDIEGGPERETAPPETEPPKEEEQGEIVSLEKHIEVPAFDDSPSAVTDLTPALETLEELEETDFLAVEGPPEGEAPEPPLPEEATAPFPSEAAAADAKPEDVPSPPAAELLPGEKEFREMFSARAREIFEKVAAETVEKVMWEVMDSLTKEFTEKIRESVEAVAWEVVPATTEALIREEIARIREQAGKESS